MTLQRLEAPLAFEHVLNETMIATEGEPKRGSSLRKSDHEIKNSGNVDAAHAAWHAVATDESNTSATTFKIGEDVPERQSVEVVDSGDEISQPYPISVDSGIAEGEGELGEKPESADEASLKVWGAYQQWRVTKIRLGGILINQKSSPPSFPLASSIYSSVLG